jgi:hypothetical protein
MDQDALDFDRFYLEYRRAVLKAAFSLLNDWHRAEDVTQEAFLRLYRKTAGGEMIQSPKGFVQSWAYFRALRMLRPPRSEPVPTDSGKLTYLMEHRVELSWLRSDRSLEALLEPAAVPGWTDPWESLGYWGGRMIAAATRSSPAPLRRRLLVLLCARNRCEALAQLVEEGGPTWARSSVYRTLSRYSVKIDAFLRRTKRTGPQSFEEQCHWPFFQSLCRICPGLSDRGRPHQSTLCWLIRGLQRLDSAERLELVSRFFNADRALAREARRLRRRSRLAARGELALVAGADVPEGDATR